MTGSKIRIGICGLGFGRYGLLPAFRRDPRCEVVAMCGTDQAKTERYTKEFGIPRAYGSWQRLVEDPAVNVIACALPPHVQPEVAIAGLAAGKPVFAEKPLAVTVAEAEAMTRAAAGKPAMIDFMFPELDTWQQAKRALDAGAIGRLRHLIVDWKVQSYDTSRGIQSWKTAMPGGGALRHFGTHALYHCEWFGGEIAQLSGRLFRAPDQPWSTNSLASVAFEFRSGASGVLTMATSTPFGSGQRVELYGTEGMIRIDNPTPDPIHGFTLTIARRGQKAIEVETEPVEQTPGLDSRVRPVSRLLTRFLDWIETGREQAPSFADGLRVQKLVAAIEAADQSARATR